MGSITQGECAPEYCVFMGVVVDIIIGATAKTDTVMHALTT